MFREVFMMLFLAAATKSNEHGVFFKVSENQFPIMDENIVWNGKVSSMMTCSQMCARKNECRSAGYRKIQRICSLFGLAQPSYLVAAFKQDEWFYLEKVVLFENDTALPGTIQSSAVSSCHALKPLTTSSGVYWINPGGGSQDHSFKAFCDMETAGGGWTLVWSYKFTNYAPFTNMSNAITPRPNWPTKKANVPISTIPPLSETDYNAVNFSLWNQLGKQILIKSNINNWLRCHQGTGSLVDWQDGSISCQIIHRVVTGTCVENEAPSKLSHSKGYGPIFYSTGRPFKSTYYYFDGSTARHWPTHDPCGTNKPNHMMKVDDPHGNIYIRK